MVGGEPGGLTPRDRPPPQPGASLAEKLQYLFDNVPGPDGKRWTQAQVAKAISTPERPVGRAYLSQLLSGIKDNPNKKILEALATLFDVSPAFFFDDEASAAITDQIEFAKKLKDGGTREFAARRLADAPMSDVELVAVFMDALEKHRRIDRSDRTS